MFHIKKRVLIAGVMTAGLLAVLNSLYLNKFQIEVFIIIIVLGYLLSYKLVDYLADFKTIQNKSRTDIVFLVLFFVLLFIPMSHIDKSDRSSSENRKLAKWENPIIDKKINYQFGDSFNKWYNDRFFGRLTLIKGKLWIEYLLNRKVELTNNIYFKKRKNILQLNLLPKGLMMSDNNIEKTIVALRKMQKFCDENNIKFYVLITPTHNFIHYDEFYPYVNPKELEQFNDMIKYITDKSGVEVLYLCDYLLSANKNTKQLLYYKDDNHWTDEGAYLGYTELLRVMQKDFPQLKPVNKDEIPSFYSNKVRRVTMPEMYDIGNLIKPFSFCLDIIKYKPKTKYKHYRQKPDLEATLRKEDYYLGYDYHYPRGMDKRAMVIGTSMNSALLAFLPYNFKDLKFIRLNSPRKIRQLERFKVMKYYKKEILDYKPDVIIYSVSTSNSTTIKYMMKDN